MQSDVKRGRIKDICQPCSIMAYNKSRPPGKTSEDKAEYMRQYYRDRKEDLAGYYSDYRMRIKQEMIAAYGGECVECGEADPIVLNLDHIEDNGSEERQITERGGFKFYMYLRRNNWPDNGYQLLCCNCNYRKEYWRRRNAISFFKTS